MASDVLGVILIVLAVILIAVMAVGIYFLVKLIRLGRLVHNDLMPLRGKIMFWTGVVYMISPLDLMPDPIYLDDIGVLAGAAAYITHLARKFGVIEQVRGVVSGRNGVGDPPASRQIGR